MPSERGKKKWYFENQKKIQMPTISRTPQREESKNSYNRSFRERTEALHFSQQKSKRTMLGQPNCIS